MSGMGKGLDVGDDQTQLKTFKAQEIVAGEASASSSLNWYRKAHGIRSTIEVATAVRHLALAPDLTVLDAGAGVGRVTLELAAHAKAVVAVDISPANVNQLLKHARERRLENISVIAADLNELRLEEGSFDRAVAVEVLQHIPSASLREDAAARICHALKRNGIFVTINNKWHPDAGSPKEGTYADGRYRFCFSPSDMTDLLGRAGFSKVVVRGCVNLPFRLGSVARFAPRAAVALDVWFSSRKLSVATGQFLVAIAVK
jgi:SAM-dependent methyltransferase